MTSVDFVAVIITITGLVAAFIARKTWLLVEGDLAESWRWILPSVPVYAISFLILIIHNYTEKFSVTKPVFAASIVINIKQWDTIFNMQVWEPIILVLRNVQVLAELLFLVLVLTGLLRQYKLFKELYDKQS